MLNEKPNQNTHCMIPFNQIPESAIYIYRKEKKDTRSKWNEFLLRAEKVHSNLHLMYFIPSMKRDRKAKNKNRFSYYTVSVIPGYFICFSA